MDRLVPFSGWQHFLADAETRALFGENVGHVPTDDDLHPEIIHLAELVDQFSHVAISSQGFDALASHCARLDEAKSSVSHYLDMRQSMRAAKEDYATWVSPSKRKLQQFERTVFQYQRAKVRCYAELKSRCLFHTDVLQRQTALSNGELVGARVKILCHIKAWAVYLREMTAFDLELASTPISELLDYANGLEYVLEDVSNGNTVVFNLGTATVYDKKGLTRYRCRLTGIKNIFSDDPRVIACTYLHQMEFRLCTVSQLSRILDNIIHKLVHGQENAEALAVVLPRDIFYHEKVYEVGSSTTQPVDSPLLQGELDEEVSIDFPGIVHAQYYRLCGLQALHFQSIPFTVPQYDIGKAVVILLHDVLSFVPYTIYLSSLEIPRIDLSVDERSGKHVFLVPCQSSPLQCYVPQIHRKTYKGKNCKQSCLTSGVEITIADYPDERVLHPPRIWARVPRPLSVACETELRKRSLRWCESAERLHCYMLESDWHAVRLRFLITGYEDAIFCTEKKFPFFALLRHRPRHFGLTRLRIRLAKARFALKKGHAVSPSMTAK